RVLCHFELSDNGQIRLSREKILGLIDLAILLWRIFDVDGRNAKQFARAFAIASRNDRRVNVNESAFLKEFVNSESEPAADAKNRAEKIRAGPQVGDLAQKLRGVSFLL